MSILKRIKSELFLVIGLVGFKVKCLPFGVSEISSVHEENDERLDEKDVDFPSYFAPRKKSLGL